MTLNHTQEPSLPPLLMTSEPGSFARRTIVKRKPQIIQQVIEDTPYPPDIVQALEAFAEEIATSPMQPLREHTAELEADIEIWNRELAKYQGRPWLDAPWYFAEAYFYRRLMEAVCYFQHGPWKHHDPFGVKKRVQIERAITEAFNATGLTEILAGGGARSETGPALMAQQIFDLLLHSALWGNRADLSNYTIQVQAWGGLGQETFAQQSKAGARSEIITQPNQETFARLRHERSNVLIDHTDAVRYLLSTQAASSESTLRVAFINDNVGLDVLFDLMLSDFLLSREWVHEVALHLKAWPFFVSDAMPQDILTTIALLKSSTNVGVRQLGVRLSTYIETGHLVLKADPFWTSPLMFRRMPPSLHQILADADLVILKGDVNYRRLLGDRHWPYTTRMEAITAYFPVPFLVLRTLKGEIMVGLQPGQAEALAAEDPTWLINGKRGVIQLVYPKENR